MAGGGWGELALNGVSRIESAYCSALLIEEGMICVVCDGIVIIVHSSSCCESIYAGT
jgi:hypothetical protein